MRKPRPARNPMASSKPLTGRRILVGRARHQASLLSKDLRKLGAQVIEIPFIEIRNPRSFRLLDSALNDIFAYDWLILTSVNGVDAMWDRMNRLGITRRSLRHLQVAAIGPATKKAIEKRRLKVNVVPEEYVAESVVHSLATRVAGKRILLVRAKVARDVIPRELQKAGAQVDVVEAYETVVPKSSRPRLRSLMKSSRRAPHVITFTSSSTVRNFVALLGQKPNLDCIKLASIGPVTSATLREFSLDPDIEATEYTIPGLIRSIVANVAAGGRFDPAI
jgi:uroporphyrinogen-III synthase